MQATGNNGCLDFTGLGGNALSYKVTSHDFKRTTAVRCIRSTPKRSFSSRLEDQHWLSQAEYFRGLLELSDDEATGSLSPHWDPYAHVDAGFGHGNVTHTFDRTWKWQQTALGISIGIPIEEWDDEIHQPRDDFVVFGDHDYDAMISKRWMAEGLHSTSNSLERRWNYGQCRAVLSCGQQFAGGAAATISNGWTQTVQAWNKAKVFGQTLYDFGHAHPISVSITVTAGGTAAGYGLGRTGGGATAQDNDQLGSCANGSSQVNAFIQSLIDVGYRSLTLRWLKRMLTVCCS